MNFHPIFVKAVRDAESTAVTAQRLAEAMELEYKAVLRDFGAALEAAANETEKMAVVKQFAPRLSFSEAMAHGFANSATEARSAVALFRSQALIHSDN